MLVFVVMSFYGVLMWNFTSFRIIFHCVLSHSLIVIAQFMVSFALPCLLLFVFLTSSLEVTIIFICFFQSLLVFQFPQQFIFFSLHYSLISVLFPAELSPVYVVKTNI